MSGGVVHAGRLKTPPRTPSPTPDSLPSPDNERTTGTLRRGTHPKLPPRPELPLQTLPSPLPLCHILLLPDPYPSSLRERTAEVRRDTEVGTDTHGVKGVDTFSGPDSQLVPGTWVTREADIHLDTQGTRGPSFDSGVP